MNHVELLLRKRSNSVALPLDFDELTQDKLRQRGRAAFHFMNLATLLVLPAFFLAFGYVITVVKEGSACGVVGERTRPGCATISWEFGVGLSCYAVVVLFGVLTGFLTFIVGPKRVSERRARLKEASFLAALHHVEPFSPLSPASSG